MAAEQAKVDPMYQFTIEPLAGSGAWELAGYNIAFTNSALWMLITTVVLFLFVLGGMKRELVPGRWQMVVEFFTGFIDDMLEANIGKAGRKYVPYVFSLFMFILFANLLGLLPLGVVGLHPFTFTSHFTVTGVLAIISFSIVLLVGFWKHGLHFFSLFVPEGTPLPLDRMLPAFSEGVQQMQPGGTYRLTIPGDQGYGAEPPPGSPIPPNSPLIFEVELLEIK